MNLRVEPGFLNTNASLLADLTLTAYIFLLVPAMLVGFYYARRKKFVPNHKFTMTGITILNWILIIFIMAVSYSDSVAPNVPDDLSDRFYLFPTLHLITGGTAQILATYLVIRMWFEKTLPQWIMVKNIKLYMRTTLTLWLVTAVLGAGIYLTWYTGDTTQASDTPLPLATEEPSSEAPPASDESEMPGEEVPEPEATDEG